MKHIIQFSGGICSFFAAKRVVEKYRKENVILLFCDTLIEDEDLYRFIEDTKKYLGCEFVRVCDGRTPFEVYKDVKFLGNSRVAHCTKLLKTRQAKMWLKEHYKEDECMLYVGIDWTEIHRCEAIKKNWDPYTVEFPMCDKPYLTKIDMQKELEKIGRKVPRLYKMGFSHNNCGGFCCKAGQGHWANVLETMPEKFKEYEEKEQEIIKYIGKDVSMMKKIKNGKAETYTLKQLREDYEKDKSQIDLFDVCGCGCFSEEE